jgi:hypothetical protein
VDSWLAKQALQRISTAPISTLPQAEKVPYKVRGKICFHPQYAPGANPANWEPVYLERLGADNLSAYLYAWNATYLETYTAMLYRSKNGLSPLLADNFIERLKGKGLVSD